jgi:hypothetical protein
MRQKITVYLSSAELAEFRRAAGQRRLSVSRYARARLMPMPSGGDGGNQLLLEQLNALILMVDQFARSMLTHSPEIPAQQAERLAAGEQRYRDWQEKVAALIERWRITAAGQQRATNGSGAQA